MTTGFVFHESYMWHDTGSAGLFLPSTGYIQPDRHIEGPEAKRRIKNLMDVSGLSERVTPVRPRPATRDEVLRFHTPAYIDRLEDQARRSARMRYALTGVWTQDLPEEDVRARIDAARLAAMDSGLDIGAPLPPA